MRRQHQFALVFCTLVAILGIFLLVRVKDIPAELVNAIETSEAQAAVAPAEILIIKTKTSLTEVPANLSETIGNDFKEHNLTGKQEMPPTVTIKSPAVPPLLKSLPTNYDVRKLSDSIQVLTNDSRTKNDLPSLTLDATLTKLAIDRSKDMITNNYFSHTSQSGCDLTCRFRSVDFVTYYWGENLAQSTGYDLESESETAQTFLNGWLNSKSHRENILSANYTRQGVGVATKGDRLVLTVLFAR